jgi:hypothetical protein
MLGRFVFAIALRRSGDSPGILSGSRGIQG